MINNVMSDVNVDHDNIQPNEYHTIVGHVVGFSRKKLVMLLVMWLVMLLVLLGWNNWETFGHVVGCELLVGCVV